VLQALQQCGVTVQTNIWYRDPKDGNEEEYINIRVVTLLFKAGVLKALV
jgi:hypothetical protein